jgi:hypothetical protein
LPGYLIALAKWKELFSSGRVDYKGCFIRESPLRVLSLDVILLLIDKKVRQQGAPVRRIWRML